MKTAVCDRFGFNTQSGKVEEKANALTYQPICSQAISAPGKTGPSRQLRR